MKEICFEGTPEKGVERFDDSVEALVDCLLLGKHPADVGDLGFGSGVGDDGRRTWVGWGGKKSS